MVGGRGINRRGCQGGNGKGRHTWPKAAYVHTGLRLFLPMRLEALEGIEKGMDTQVPILY